MDQRDREDESRLSAGDPQVRRSESLPYIDRQANRKPYAECDGDIPAYGDTDADSESKLDAEPQPYRDAYGVALSHTHLHSDVDYRSDANSYADRFTDQHQHPEPHTNAYGYRDCLAYGDADAHSNAE